MEAVATDWIGDRQVPAGTDGQLTSDVCISRAVTKGTIVTFTDSAMTEGCQGRADSEQALLDSALLWLGARGGTLPCAAMQLGFDAGGRPRLVVALGDADGAARDGSPWRSSDGVVEIEVLPCTLVTFTGRSAERAGEGQVSVLELLGAMRDWVGAHQDFSCEAVQVSNDLTGRTQVVLVGEGWPLD